MGMTLRRYHAARQERINKNEALEEAKQTILYDKKSPSFHEEFNDSNKPAVYKKAAKYEN